MQYEIGQDTLSGTHSAQNQDTALVQRHGGDPAADAWLLAALADGLGGHPGGEIASALAVAALSQHVGAAPSGPSAPTLRDGFHAAHRRLRSQGEGRSTGRPMATTLLVAVVGASEAYIANVGDSRAYLLAGDVIRQVTVDHNAAAEQLQAGLLTDVGALHSPLRHLVTRCLGETEEPSVDVFGPFVWSAGTRLLLISDGAYIPFSDGELRDLLREGSCQEAAERIVHAARNAGSRDDASAIVIGDRGNVSAP